MPSTYTHDVFLSFARRDKNVVRPIYEQLARSGFDVFWSERKIEAGTSFSSGIMTALSNSQHYALYCSHDAINSDWVSKELEYFHDHCHMKDQENRRMFVVLADDCPEDDVPSPLKSLQRAKTPGGLVEVLVKGKIKKLETNVSGLQAELREEKRKVDEARKYYRHSRFWSSTAHKRDIHIFTCGRDLRHTDDSARGYGGRTNIDMWDYRAVLDITHFFASNYPSATITIEDPISKLHGKDLKHAPHLADRIAFMRSMLEDKDCIIVGSPDVSDFAEVVLAHIHGIDPYTEGRHKTNGFVIVKAEKKTNSSFYWQKEEDEQEGVAQIKDDGTYEYFVHRLAHQGGASGKMHGILVVANNPFVRDGNKRRITILSGFSGVATNAIAKILTDESYLDEFFRLDGAYANLDLGMEALIGVEYSIGMGQSFDDRDSRKIERITFEKLVELPIAEY